MDQILTMKAYLGVTTQAIKVELRQVKCLIHHGAACIKQKLVYPETNFIVFLLLNDAASKSKING